MYVTAPEPISTATSYIPPISLCVSMCIPPIVARHRFGKHVHAATTTGNSERTVGHGFLYGPCRIKGECVYPPIVVRQWLGTRSSGNEGFLMVSFSMRSVSYQMTVCGSVCVSSYRC
jgi:hypothetical protein